jgi:vacuolar-type H+-ATPase subunit I/STV1
MAQSKHEYFHLGVTNQTRPDITVELKRADRKMMARWTDQQRRGLIEFLKDCEQSFAAFKGEILAANELLNSEQEVQGSVATDGEQGGAADPHISLSELTAKLERVEGCSNARKAEILRLRESLDEMAEELEKKSESASMWAQKATDTALERNQLAAEVERLRGEREALQAWKDSALACTPDWQAIGKALNLQLGTSVSDQVLPGILNLLKDRHELVIQLRRQQAYCTRYVRAYQSTARYREVETLLDQHHHSTVEP